MADREVSYGQSAWGRYGAGMSEPEVSVIARAPKTQRPEGVGSGRAASWDDVTRLLRAGGGLSWLATTGPEQAPHVRPVFAAWTGESLVIASNPKARKTAALEHEPRCSVAIDLSELHVVVEGVARRLTSPADLTRATVAFSEVYDWPTTVVGDRIDADGAAPSSGGPPFYVYEVTPIRAFGFPTADQVEPTRWRFGTAT